MDDFAFFTGRGGGYLLQLHELASRKPFKCVDPWGTRFCPNRNSFRYAVAIAFIASESRNYSPMVRPQYVDKLWKWGAGQSLSWSRMSSISSMQHLGPSGLSLGERVMRTSVPHSVHK